jgi:serine/threonine-protein kinase
MDTTRPREATGEPDRVGPYRILSQLGRGGMGAVYLAEREGADFTQRVALKLLTSDAGAGVGDPLLAGQLRSERRILARLEHPGIARFIDGGTTREGRSYIAMEYIEGTTLLEYCERGQLGVEARLHLFLDVCDAVQYAHQQLVVHRDLKPRNIMVTSEGRAKLLDFGIAKLTGGGAGSSTGTDHSQTGMWLTPAYASPEQVRGDPVTTATDVYACGVLLYEALTGMPPYEVDGLPAADVERIVCQYTPERPSARVRDARLRRELAGDLDSIVLKALAKEPDRRYASMRDLGEDMQRYLDRRPILARPDSAAYRASRFLRRHRMPVASAALVLVLLIAGVVTASLLAAKASRERDRAEVSRRQSEDATAFLIGLFQANDATEGLMDSVTAGDLFARGIERAEALEDQPLVQAQMYDAMGQVAINLSRYDMARDLFTRALTLRRAADPDGSPELAASLRHLAGAEARLGDHETNVALVRESLAMDQRVLGSDHPVTLNTLELMARVAMARGWYREGEALQREALARRTEVQGKDHPDTIHSLRALAVWRLRSGHLQEAEILYRSVLEQQTEILGLEHDDVLETKLRLGDMLYTQTGDFEEAERLFRDVLGVQRARFGDQDRRLRWAKHSLGVLLDTLGRFQEADALFADILTLSTRVMGPEHMSTIAAMEIMGSHLRRAGRYQESLAAIQEALDLKRALVGERNLGVVGTMYSEAWTYMRMGEYALADSIFRVGNAIVEDEWSSFTSRRSDGYRALAMNAVYWGRYEYAQANIDRARDIIAPLLERGEVTTDYEPLVRLDRTAAMLDAAWADPDRVERQ